MSKKKKKEPGNIIATNRKAAFKYHLEDRFEAGIVLVGSEVKSLRAGKANLTDSFATIIKGEIWLINCHISPYEYSHQFNHAPKRDRKLLMHKKEIMKLMGKLNEKGLTLVPVKMYFKSGHAKVELALAKGKRLFDKREAIKKRESDRTLRRVLKNR